MNQIKTVSQKGLQQLFIHEGMVPGLYDCPAHHATFGVGTLAHQGPSEILRWITTAPQPKAGEKGPSAAKLSAYIKLYKPPNHPKNAPGVPYLDAEIGKDKDYVALIEKRLASATAAEKRLINSEHALLNEGWDAYLADFRVRIQKFEKAVSAAFADVPLTQDQFDGLFSLTYNIGVAGLFQSHELIRAMKAYAAIKPGAPAQKQKAASVLLECILRARPTARASVSGEVDDVSFRLTESGVFNKGLFNRRVEEASVILQHKYSKGDPQIEIARRTIKADKDHAASAKAKGQARQIIKVLNTIGHINRGGLL